MHYCKCVSVFVKNIDGGFIRKIFKLARNKTIKHQANH